jgi:hypothetical protein
VNERVPAPSADAGAELKAGPPALDASQQPGFKVVEETPRAASSKLVWTAVIVVLVVLAAYILGYFR